MTEESSTTDNDDNVVLFPGITRLDVDPERILDAARGQLAGVIVIGYTKDGDEYFASSYADGGMCLWLARRFEHALMKVADPPTAEGREG